MLLKTNKKIKRCDLNVYGSKGDSGTNDITAIQNVINIMSDGDTIFFSEGEKYDI